MAIQSSINQTISSIGGLAERSKEASKKSKKEVKALQELKAFQKAVIKKRQNYEKMKNLSDTANQKMEAFRQNG